jgi:predicted small lipoprotein YifL
MQRFAFLAAALVLLAQGCGIKGPLYLETPEQRRMAEERRERREAAQQRERSPEAVSTSPRGTTPTTPATTPSDTADSATERGGASEFPVGDEAFGPSAPPQ